jgi:hypothetical protein
MLCGVFMPVPSLSLRETRVAFGAPDMILHYVPRELAANPVAFPAQAGHGNPRRLG